MKTHMTFNERAYVITLLQHAARMYYFRCVTRTAELSKIMIISHLGSHLLLPVLHLRRRSLRRLRVLIHFHKGIQQTPSQDGKNAQDAHDGRLIAPDIKGHQGL
mmetsp:Transcript_13091/g.26280  ORF Transcript_13091/g.26280 Transcript_13091/m.26280 type:complete len:104 (-) Transcript_13091:1082-1393(-)